MNVLIICNWGKNRSRYLASYLQQKRYTVKHEGIYAESDNPVKQATIDWSDVLIFVQSQTKKDFEESFNVSGQKMITLDVEDRISVLAPEKEILSSAEWTKIQQEKVYPELERQIEKYLPF